MPMIDKYAIGPDVIISSADKSDFNCKMIKCSDTNTKDLPSKTVMAKNIAMASKQALMSGFKKVSEEEHKRRHLICKSRCEFYRHGDDRCSKCGCFTTYKSRLEAWHCPIDKW